MKCKCIIAKLSQDFSNDSSITAVRFLGPKKITCKRNKQRVCFSRNYNKTQSRNRS